MTGKQLMARNATITTASVEVKTLTIKGKQVTLAVFRQLKDEPLIAEDGTLLGEPWGIVNYHPDKCADAPEHLHVVWQKDDALRRSAVQMPHAGYHSHPLADLYVVARITEGTVHAAGGGPEYPDTLYLGEKVPEGRTFYQAGRFLVGTMMYESRISADTHEKWRRGNPVDRQLVETFRDVLVSLDIAPSAITGDIAASLFDLIPAEQYQDTVDQLTELPQLFIAV
ncbi:hypothetical protein AB0K86_33035 [Streptomyces clavifer]|uniref:hypothetical protein n=1 Tax=Streptomyces TaxID=1883 RepID=UPI0006F9E8D2|nr:hypothetical protein [Streptomyces sp. Root55]KQZ07264.1 hypothetical protein ASD51_34305 [Streptomyces sp. Root55]